MALQPSNTGRPLTCKGRPLAVQWLSLCLPIINLVVHKLAPTRCVPNERRHISHDRRDRNRPHGHRTLPADMASLAVPSPLPQAPRAPRVCRACAGSARTPRHPPAGHDALITSLMDDLNYGKCDELITVANNTIMTVITYYIIVY